MARITVEDCLEQIPNRFEMTLIASRRARQISMGHKPMVELQKDKSTVLALREIAEGLISQKVLDDIHAVEEAERTAAKEAELLAANFDMLAEDMGAELIDDSANEKPAIVAAAPDADEEEAL